MNDFEKQYAALEKKYAGFSALDSIGSHKIDDPLVTAVSLAKKLTRKELSLDVGLAQFQRIGDYFADFALLSRDHSYEKRWGPNDKRTESRNVKKNKRSEDASGRRSTDNMDSKGVYSTQVREGYEEFFATLIFDMFDYKKRDKFLNTFFDGKTVRSTEIIGSYYRGDSCFNNNLMYTLMLGENTGKDIALKIAGTMDRIRSDKVMGERITHLDSFVTDISRLHYLGGGSKSYKTYLAKISKENPQLSQDIQREDLRELFLYAGDVKTGTTFKNRLVSTKEQVLRMFGIKGYDIQGPGNFRQFIPLNRPKEAKEVTSKKLDEDLDKLGSSAKKTLSKKVPVKPKVKKTVRLSGAKTLKVDFNDPSLNDDSSFAIEDPESVAA